MLFVIVKVLDDVYNKYYNDFNIERLLYLGMDASFGDSELTNDEQRRLKNLGLI